MPGLVFFLPRLKLGEQCTTLDQIAGVLPTCMRLIHALCTPYQPTGSSCPSLAKLYCCAILGLDGGLIEVEFDLLILPAMLFSGAVGLRIGVALLDRRQAFTLPQHML